MDLDFISKDVREYMEQNGLAFSDFEKAALICRLHRYQFDHRFDLTKRTELLKKLAEETKDEALKDRIMENLVLDQVWLDAFWNNTEGYVYEVQSWDTMEEPFICGRFATADMAYAYGVKQRRRFMIKKFLIVGSPGQNQQRIKGVFCPRVNWDVDLTIVTEENGWSSVACADYSADGILEFFLSSEWSPEIERSTERLIKKINDPENYENAFLSVPNPFERGDIVKIVGDGKHGIIGTSQQEWQELLEKAAARGSLHEDVNLDVFLLRDDVIIENHPFPPASLERYEPKREDDDCEFLLAAQAMLRGEGDLWEFLDCCRRYKERETDWEKEFKALELEEEAEI